MFKIKLIAGLGNPGSKYANTRHNLGYRAVDRLLENTTVKRESDIPTALVYETEKYGLLCKPITYMNHSGKALMDISRAYNITAQEILLLYDDFALQLGLIRVRARGSSGGHNGLQSIIDHFQSAHLPRIRLGIQTEEMDNWVDFVLANFHRAEKPIVAEMLDLCCDAVEVILQQGIASAMNRFNKKQKLVQ
ncbi:MAG TPA: aminoacyl-tRNA hydrolase [Acidobacteriota bacterium]|nr:aminoacyl-tRNA hydrolase [Acidobacteriota bacterium]